MNPIKNLLLILLLSTLTQAKDYSQHTSVKNFIKMMKTKHAYNQHSLSELFKNIKFQKKSLGIFNPKYRQKPKQTWKKSKYVKHGSWTRYESHLLTKAKIALGVNYLRDNKEVFKKVYQTYGVPPEYVAAIIGVETRYGIKRGTYPIFDTLTTLAFEENRRSSYFKKELENFLLLTREQKVSPLSVKGSYAGAIGLGQFMPSAYAPFAVDFDGDGIRSMQQNPDAIASVANYLKKNGWRKWEPVAERVTFKGGARYTAKKTGYTTLYPQSQLKSLKLKYGDWGYQQPVRLIKLDRYRYDELWFAAKNFYVITRYNHSAYYAMAVHQLAQKLKRGYKQKHGVFLR